MQNVVFNDFNAIKGTKIISYVSAAIIFIFLICMFTYNRQDKNPKKDTKPAAIQTTLKKQTYLKKPEPTDNIVMDNAQISRLRTLLLPTPQHNKNYPALLPPPQLAVATQNNSLATPTQHCVYNNQSYIPGDILKTDQGWIQCTPTIIFAPDNSATRQIGSPAWTAIR